MTADALTQILDTGHRILDFIRQRNDVYDDGGMEELMLDVYELGRAISASPELRSNAAVQQFLEETTSVLMSKGYVALSFYPPSVTLRFEDNWEGDEWEQLCIARSGIEFFIELFRETALSEEAASMDTREMDAFIRARGDEGHLSDDEIPPEIPLAHWWWWYPEAPRSRPQRGR